MAGDDTLSLFGDETRSTLAAAPAAAASAPLAERMRPRSLAEVVGQDALVGPNGSLRRLAESDALPSLILWGPPGCGKTTLARLLADDPSRSSFVLLSAVSAGVRDVREVVERARHEARGGRRTVLFLDEIHRFNRAQQDALLPHVERGVVTLIGATTENPSFEVIAPLLSRCRVVTLAPLGSDAIEALLARAIGDRERGLGALCVRVEPGVLAAIAANADGDARRALGLLEAAVGLARTATAGGAEPERSEGDERARGARSEPERSEGDEQARGERSEPTLTLDVVRSAAGSRWLRHDRDREQHYDVVSAFIKCLRASDPDAALYWAARMLEGGEDPRFVARRLVIFASEDVGNAEPAGLPLAMAAYQAVERIGMPEARINLGQAITFLACAPKSNASYLAIDRALEAVRAGGAAPVPLHLRNAPTGLLRELGYGAGYRNPHAEPEGFVETWNLPDSVGEARFYEPLERGREAPLRDGLATRRARRRPPGA